MTRTLRQTRSPLRAPVASLALGLLAHAAIAAIAACGPPPEPPAPPAPTATAAVTATPAPEPTATATATAEVAAAPVCKEPAGPRPSVVNLTKDTPVQSWTAWTGDKSAPVDKACQKVLGRRTKLLGNVPDSSIVDDVSRCLPSAKGAWVLDGSDVRPLKKDKTHPESGWTVPFALSYVGPDGKQTRGKTVTGASSSRGQEKHYWIVLGTFDYDGDGVSEIAVADVTDYGEESSETRKVYTWKDGDVVEYPHVNFQFSRMLDVDGDKRPDLVVTGPFEVEGPCGLNGQMFRAPPHVAHSLPDGTFSRTDAVAQEVVRAQCGPLETDLLVLSKDGGETRMDDGETARRLTCARIYGAKSADVVARVRKDYPFAHNADDTNVKDGPQPCLPLTALVKLASQEPQFTLEAPCPAK